MSQQTVMPTTAERVARSTSDASNRAIRAETEACIKETVRKGPAAVEERLRELDREWDIERMLEANASTLILTGVALAATVDKRFLAIPGVVAGFLLQHALQGWCPPLPLFRKMGVRTAKEIAQERYALKVLRGDFDTAAASDVNAVLEEVRR